MVTLQTVLSLIALVVACAALAVSFLAFRQARKTAAFSSRREAIVHVRNAIFDVARDGNITTKTVASIRDALQISSLVSQPKIIDELDQAFVIASRLEHKPFERLTDQDFNDRAAPPRRTSGDVMPPEGAGNSAMEYYRNAAIEKTCAKPIHWLAIKPTGGMVDEGERACPGEGARW